MKLVSWNVNGLRAVVGKGFADIFDGFDADCVCLQETKMQAGQLDLEFLGYTSYWNYADKKGYSGTAIYTRVAPLSVSYGISVDEHDHEGRVITIEFEDFYLVNVYVPNSQDGLRRLDYRMTWEDDFRAYLKSLENGTAPLVGGVAPVAADTDSLVGAPAENGSATLAGGVRRPAKPVVVCGDMNVAHEEIDLKNPATNHMSAGFSDEERGKMTELLAAGFTDSWRFQHPTDVKYSWWSYRMAARERNVGWRIDYFLVSDSLRPRISATEIHNDVFGSDHCPVSLLLD